jgi:hypothetical protein
LLVGSAGAKEGEKKKANRRKKKKGGANKEATGPEAAPAAYENTEESS